MVADLHTPISSCMALAPHHWDACHQVADLHAAQLKLHSSCSFSSPFPSTLPVSFKIYGSLALGFSFMNSNNCPQILFVCVRKFFY